MFREARDAIIPLHMALAPGTRVGPYEIVSTLGAGGMGEVYRARDSKLNRDVAIKVLLAAVSNDPDRLARFNREAQVLASLNHPNIAAIYGLEDNAIVMELVEGPTLAERLALGAIPVDEAIAIARQMADALATAHEAGVIHRDLKPANIKVRPDGTVKVLDFGLAKALDPTGGSSAEAMNSPTISLHATQQGVVLGTAAYMAPEQARGRVVDRRADIWAFGVVLFEMLAGRRAFDGDDISITLASVLKDDLNWAALPADLPSPVRRLLRRCLEKDPKRRLSSIGDARLELDDASTAPAEDRVVPPASGVAASAPVSRPVLSWIVAAVASVIAVTAVTFWAPWRAAVALPMASFEVQASTTGTSGPSMIALSPDGRLLVARVIEAGTARLWLRPLERVTGTALAGTEGSSYPFWSADSRSIGFFADLKLKKIDILGAPPQTVADAPTGFGGAWNGDDVILFSPNLNGALFRVAASGGPPVQVTELNPSRAELSHRFPRFLPDRVHFLYFVVSSKPEHTGIYVASLNSKETKLLVASSTRPEFAPPDLLLFLRESTLMAQRLDLGRLELSGDPFRVAEQVASNSANGAAGVAVSENGVLAYRTGGTSGGRQLAWIDRSGKPDGIVGTPALYENPRLSPDGKRLAVFKPEGGGDIWINDLERGSSTRFTFDAGSDNVPVWSPDGSRIAFVSNRDGGVFNLYQKSSSGTGDDELLLKTPNNKLLNDWSADGRYLLYQELDPKTKDDLWVLPLFGDRKPARVLGTPFNEQSASFSPDGRWIAYESDESGTRQVYVQGFPASGGKWQISTSTSDGLYPRWRSDGKELFYDRAGQLMAVDLTGTVPGGPFKAGTPQELFPGLSNLPPHNYDVTPGGQRFLVVVVTNHAAGPAPIVVVLNWKTGLLGSQK